MGSVYGSQLQTATATASTAQTDTALVAAVTGRKIAVVQVFIMSDTATTFTIEEGTTVKFRAFPAANGGVVLTAPEGEYLWIGTVSTGLTYTTADASNVFVSVLYDLV